MKHQSFYTSRVMQDFFHQQYFARFPSASLEGSSIDALHSPIARPGVANDGDGTAASLTTGRGGGHVIDDRFHSCIPWILEDPQKKI